MRRSVWLGCLAMVMAMVGGHLAGCRHDWPVMLFSMAAPVAALLCLLRAGVTAHPERAARLALSPEDERGPEAQPSGLRPRPLALLAVLALGGVCLLLTLAAVWMAFRAAARPERRVSNPPLRASEAGRPRGRRKLPPSARTASEAQSTAFHTRWTVWERRASPSWERRHLAGGGRQSAIGNRQPAIQRGVAHEPSGRV